MAMTEEEYRSERERISHDERYPPALREWMLETLRKVYEEQGGEETASVV